MATMERGAIFFLTGPPGVGKSTVAKALANHFEKSIHFDIDHMRLRVVKGLSLPRPGNFGEETQQQFDLAHVATGKAAKFYADAGFTVVAEHCSHTPYIESFMRHAGPTTVVSLCADLETNLHRNSFRTSDSFDYGALGFVIQMMSESMPVEHTEAGFTLLNTTDLSVEQTVRQILNGKLINPSEAVEPSCKGKAPIFFLTGAPGVGKSTTGRALAERFERSILFDIDYFRSLVVKGLKQPTGGWDDETAMQFRIAHEAVGTIARTYSDAGFAVVAEHCSYPDNLRTFLECAGSGVVVALKSTIETNLARNLMRTNKSFDPKDIEHFVLMMGDSLHVEVAKADFPVIDNTNLPVEKAVDVILSLISKPA